MNTEKDARSFAKWCNVFVVLFLWTIFLVPTAYIEKGKTASASEYAFLWSIPSRYGIDYSRLFLEWLALGVLAAFCYMNLAPKVDVTFPVHQKEMKTKLYWLICALATMFLLFWVPYRKPVSLDLVGVWNLYQFAGFDFPWASGGYFIFDLSNWIGLVLGAFSLLYVLRSFMLDKMK